MRILGRLVGGKGARPRCPVSSGGFWNLLGEARGGDKPYKQDGSL